jgi:tRNA A-37 threonylcarbamoyl transferase component Bud32
MAALWYVAPPVNANGPSLPPPARVGRYHVLAKIADGGMAAVYMARRDDGEIVAIKRIREEFARNKDFLTMLFDEARIVSHLRHPNIVRYHELGNEGGQAFIAMELLVGQSLWSVWEGCRARGVRLRYEMIAWIGARVAEGLHYAHELREGEPGQEKPLGIVHRDVNATNIFVTYDGDIKIIDFGLAKAANRASKTAAGVIKGKVAYMSPEQAVGAPVDRRTDIFALGTTLWELACDRRLFKHTDDVKTLERVHAAEVPDPRLLVDGFPPALWAVLRRALSRDPDDRQSTAAELARELDAFVGRVNHTAQTPEGRLGGAVDGKVMAEVMRELFAAERARQIAWIAEASAPGGRGVAEPLLSRSSFWTADDQARPSALPGARLPAVLAPAAVPPSGLHSAQTTTRKLVPIVIAIAVVVAAVVIMALALR